MHICVGNLTIIGSDNGLSPGWRQAIIWTNAGILVIGPLGANFSEILIEILIFSFKKMHLKVLSAKWRPFCLGLIVLTHWSRNQMATIFEMIFFTMIFLQTKIPFRWWLLIQNSLKFVKPLAEPILIIFSEDIWHHWVPIIWLAWQFLTQSGRVMHIWISKIYQHCFR